MERDVGPHHVYVAGDATASYEDGVTRAVRHVLFAHVPMPLLIVFDEVAAEEGVSSVEWYFHVDGRFEGFQKHAPGRYIFRATRQEAALLHFATETSHKPPPKLPKRGNNLYRFERETSTSFLVLPHQGRIPAVTFEASHQASCVEISAELEGMRIEAQFATGDRLGYFGAREARARGPVFRVGR